MHLESEMKYTQPKSFPYAKRNMLSQKEKQRKCSRLTEGVPLVLPYCPGDVVGEVFGYRSRGVVIFDVGAPRNGTCREENKGFFFLFKWIKNTDSWLIT